MRIMISLFIVICSANNLAAQYYYKDIVSNRQLTDDFKAYKSHKVHKIKISSFDYDGAPSEGFFCEKKISKDYHKVELFSKAQGAATSLFTSYFDNNSRLVSSTDSSEISLTHNYYYYDGDGRVARVVSSVKSSDDDFLNEILEEHIYSYGEDSFPARMTVVKNKRDSTAILFQPDEHHNLAIEKDTKSGSKYYYYYDQKNQLTDVVHANEYREKLVAVYLFEYNNAGEISQVTTTEEGTNNYFIWRYSYDNGLRTDERLFGKDRRLMGSIEYNYD